MELPVDLSLSVSSDRDSLSREFIQDDDPIFIGKVWQLITPILIRDLGYGFLGIFLLIILIGSRLAIERIIKIIYYFLIRIPIGILIPIIGIIIGTILLIWIVIRFDQGIKYLKNHELPHDPIYL